MSSQFFNRQKELIQLLTEISSAITLNNLLETVEVVVYDDNSDIPATPSNISIPVTFEINKINLGAPFTRQEGFKKSSGKFIHFHDSDDSISESWLVEIVEQLKQKPELDILLTGRMDVDPASTTHKIQKYFHQNYFKVDKIASRLLYRNCLGPLGGVTFSRQSIEKIQFKNLSSCQDWQMYIEAIKHAKVLVSRPDIKFIFNKTGDDRISHNPRKKILGHLQLSRITSKQSPFKRNIRLFYLYTCKQHIYNKGGSILKFYKKNRLKIFTTFIIVSLYWRLT